MSSDRSKPSAVSIGGSPIYHHTEAKPYEPPQGEECIEQISDHIEKHLGKIESVFHEIISDTVHIDVHFVKPTDEFPFVRLVTSGMSDLPMVIPPGADVSRYAELMITLPGDWQLDQKSFEDEAWYWPVRLLKSLARLPHKYDTWLGFGHTVPNGDPAVPYASNTKLCGALVVPSITVPDEFHELRIHEHKTITFFAVVPIYAEEMALKLRDGAERLLDKFLRMDITDIVDLSRRNVAKKRFGLF
jgi:hypothetical protein